MYSQHRCVPIIKKFVQLIYFLPTDQWQSYILLQDRAAAVLALTPRQQT
jgi:hypothetical protein